MKARGSFVDGGMMFERWMKDCPDLEDVHYREIYTPIGPWLKGTDKSEFKILHDLTYVLSLIQSADFFAHDLDCGAGSTTEENQRLQMIGTLMRQNMKVRSLP